MKAFISVEIGTIVVSWFGVWQTDIVASICEIGEDLVFGSKRVNVGSCFETIKEDLWLKNLVTFEYDYLNGPFELGEVKRITMEVSVQITKNPRRSLITADLI